MSRPIFEPSLHRQDQALAWGSRQLFRRPAPSSGAVDIPWAMLAIPDGQTIASDDLDVIVNYDRADVNGTALSANATTGLITINEEGIYDIHSWCEMDNQGNWRIIEGPVFQGGQDYQDIGHGLMWHAPIAGFSIDATVMQHKTTLVAIDVGGNLAPTGVNLQVAHTRGSPDDCFNGGLTVVKIADLPSLSS